MQVRRAANVIELLEFFAERGGPATLAEIADGLGWPRSSTFNLVGTLLDRGYLYEPSLRGSYYPSPRWSRVVGRVTDRDGVPDQLRAVVDEIGRRTDETTALGAPAGSWVLMVHVRESRQMLRYFAEEGTLAPIHATSAGRAILVQMDPKEREALYRRLDFTRPQPNAPGSPDEVETRIREGVARGYHQSNAEGTPDLAGVSLSLPWGNRRFSIVVSGPVTRLIGRRAEVAALMADTLRKAGLASDYSAALLAQADRSP